jgi:phospholipid transport system substrate-binding protein
VYFVYGGTEMNHQRLPTRWAPVVGIIYFFAAATSQAGIPADRVRSTAEKVLAILQDPQLKSESKKKERSELLKQAIYPQFDFAEMAKRSLGAQWQKRSAEEQQQFVEVFTEVLEGAYVDTIESYNGEKIVVGKEAQDKNFAEVNTKILTPKGEEVIVDYRLHQATGDWKVYDVVVENISLVSNYRSQFNRVIAQSSYEELLRRMKAKQFDAPGKREKK